MRSFNYTKALDLSLFLLAQLVCGTEVAANDIPTLLVGNAASATLNVSVKDCAELAGSVGTLHFAIISNDGTLVASKSSSFAGRAPFSWSVQLRAGVYRYQVLRVPDGNAIACSIASSFAIVPGAVFDMALRLAPGTPGDELPDLHVYGLYPAADVVSVMRYDDDPACGAILSQLHGTPLAIYEHKGSYDAAAPPLPGPQTFGIKVESGDGTATIFRVTANPPTARRGLPPTGVRFDITEADLKGGADTSTLVCLN